MEHRLCDRRIGDLLSVVVEVFSFPHHQDTGAHPTSKSVDTIGSFARGAVTLA